MVRGDGVWVEDAAGSQYLDAMSGARWPRRSGRAGDIVAAARVPNRGGYASYCG